LQTWTHQQVGSVTVTVESATAGEQAAEQAQREYQRFEQEWKDACRKLDEYAHARRCHKDLDDATAWREQVRQDLVAVGSGR
jgi:hypothetical protein